MPERVVVLVDDDKTVLDALRAQVRQRFVQRCETAQSVSEALELLEELVAERCEVVVLVTDWLMPGTRGDELLAEVQRRHPQIRRVMLTGQADPAALKRVRDEALAHHVLFKPWSIEDLERAVRAALER